MTDPVTVAIQLLKDEGIPISYLHYLQKWNARRNAAHIDDTITIKIIDLRNRGWSVNEIWMDFVRSSISISEGTIRDIVTSRCGPIGKDRLKRSDANLRKMLIDRLSGLTFRQVGLLHKISSGRARQLLGITGRRLNRCLREEYPNNIRIDRIYEGLWFTFEPGSSDVKITEGGAPWPR